MVFLWWVGKKWKPTEPSNFFTVVTYRRQHLFHDEMAQHLLNHAIAKTRKNYPFTVEALPEGDDAFFYSLEFNQISRIDIG